MGFLYHLGTYQREFGCYYTKPRVITPVRERLPNSTTPGYKIRNITKKQSHGIEQKKEKNLV
jgi:hypothetical protein